MTTAVPTDGERGTRCGYGAWVVTHTRHHAHPNHAGDDPDIDIPILAFSPGQTATARGVARTRRRIADRPPPPVPPALRKRTIT